MINVKVKYLDWVNNNELAIGLFSGDVYEEKDYYIVDEYTVDDEDYSLDDVFMEFNRIDEDTYCRLTDNHRSMCVGDLISINDKWYVVKMIGFEEITI